VSDRARYRRDVERLLEQIKEKTRELQVLKAYGARSAALAERKRELKRVRMELAALTAASSA
jgi:hypothetical protein